MDTQASYVVRVASFDDYKYAQAIAEEMSFSAKQRKTGIPVRSADYVLDKMKKGLAVIAVHKETKDWVGFCCLEVWEHQAYVAGSGLVISPAYRGEGALEQIKSQLIRLAHSKFPQAKIFSLTAHPGVIHVNKKLGYEIVPFDELMQDKQFVTGCQSWVNYFDLMKRENQSTAYVAMIHKPVKEEKEQLEKMVAEQIY